MEEKNPNYQIVVLKIAEEDISLIFNYYIDHAPEMLNKLIEEYEYVLYNLRTTPTLFSKSNETFRRTLIKKFNLFVYYKIYDDINTVLIEAVVHTSREPNVWKKRDRNE